GGGGAGGVGAGLDGRDAPRPVRGPPADGPDGDRGGRGGGRALPPLRGGQPRAPPPPPPTPVGVALRRARARRDARELGGAGPPLGGHRLPLPAVERPLAPARQHRRPGDLPLDPGGGGGVRVRARGAGAAAPAPGAARERGPRSGNSGGERLAGAPGPRLTSRVAPDPDPRPEAP